MTLVSRNLSLYTRKRVDIDTPTRLLAAHPYLLLTFAGSCPIQGGKSQTMIESSMTSLSPRLKVCQEIGAKPLNSERGVVELS